MLFEISRVSDFCGEFAPCRKAFVSNERNGWKTWSIQINSLEELMELEAEVGRLILRSDSIIIFDDHIE